MGPRKTLLCSREGLSWHFSMKRFFAPVGGSSDPSKRARGDGGAEGDAGAGAGAPDAPTRQPKSFMTWNCNSFLGRMRKELDKKSFLRYVEDHDPDIIALQETSEQSLQGNRPQTKRFSCCLTTRTGIKLPLIHGQRLWQQRSLLLWVSPSWDAV